MRSRAQVINTYRRIDPAVYERERFSSPAGRLIDMAEKETVGKLLLDFEKQPDDRFSILDVACGSGRLSFYLRNCFPKAQIVGVDINVNMLPAINENKIRFVRGDLYHLPFDKESFDVVCGLRFSMHLPKFYLILEEFSRVLKKDGILIFDIFNGNSVLRVKSGDCHYFSPKKITKMAGSHGLKLVKYYGIILLGETVLRKFLASPVLIYPPRVLQPYATKLVVGLRKG